MIKFVNDSVFHFRSVKRSSIVVAGVFVVVTTTDDD